MNQKGLDYIKEINNKIKGKHPSFSNSQIVERAMRCGIEQRLFEMENNEEVELIALTTLKEDYIKTKTAQR